MKKLKINFFNYSQIFGGQEKYLSIIINFLKEEGHLIVTQGGPEELRSLNNDNDNDSDSESFFIFNGNKALYKNSFKKNSKPSLYIQHSDIEDSQGPLYKKIIRKFLLYFCLKNVDAVIRVCNKCLPDAYAKGKIITVYNGVELKTNIPKKLSDRINLLMVGAINDNKNQKLAIESLVHLKCATLTLLGTGPDIKFLRDLTIELGVEQRVDWVGYQEDTQAYYQDADLLLMLSKNEAFPFVVLESMAQGVPVVTVPVGGVPEVVKHMENGVLLENYNPESLAREIEKLIKNKSLYTELSKNSIETIKNKFSLERMTQGFLDVVNQVLEKRGVK